MHAAPEALQAGRLALLEGAMLAILRAAIEEGFDGVQVEASAESGQSCIDLTYLKNGVAVTGQDL
ncbi:hypothetical protein [Variovorax sp. PBL-E5]|uniref:hypothetical protein n=1 Tax=Variovorax sp. PBL-E5 TaxID=434014 RepID=UPI0013194C96|nr:hypothetical protein [Variovorax sp. PBL-E5]VTU36359.1 hypothetical protein E5CHR_04298 [Variovorax sp. PBL-E5]